MSLCDLDILTPVSDGDLVTSQWSPEIGSACPRMDTCIWPAEFFSNLHSLSTRRSTELLKHRHLLSSEVPWGFRNIYVELADTP